MAEKPRQVPKIAHEVRASQQPQSLLKNNIKKVAEKIVPFFVSFSPFSTRSRRNQSENNGEINPISQQKLSPQKQDERDKRIKKLADDTLNESLIIHDVLNRTGGIISSEIFDFYTKDKKTQ